MLLSLSELSLSVLILILSPHSKFFSTYHPSVHSSALARDTLSLTWSHSSYSEQAERDLFEDASAGIAGVLKLSHSLFSFTFQEVDIVLSIHFDIPMLQASSTSRPSISWPGSFPLQLHCSEHSCPSVLSLLITPS